MLHGAGDLRPSVLCIASIKETLVSFGLHCWLIDSPGKQERRAEGEKRMRDVCGRAQGAGFN